MKIIEIQIINERVRRHDKRDVVCEYCRRKFFSYVDLGRHIKAMKNRTYTKAHVHT